MMRFLVLLLCLLALPASAQLTLTGAGGSGVSAPGCAISNITLNNYGFPAGAAAGTVVGAVSVPATGCTFGGTLAIAGTDGPSGTNKFDLSSTSLPANVVTVGVVTAGSYSIDLTATDGAASNSPFPVTGIAILGASTWNPSDANVAITLTNNNLTASNGGTAAWRSVRGTSSHSTAGTPPQKYYLEVQMTSIGVNNAGQMFGLALSTAVLTNFIGASTTGYGFQNDNTSPAGWLYFNNGHGGSSVYDYARVGDTLGFAVDLAAKLVWVKNWTRGTGWNSGSGGTQDPATGAGGLSITSLSGNVFPAFSGFNGTTPATMIINTGASALVGSVPSGFALWQ